MRNRKLMMIMAGLLPDPWERQQNRLQRQLNRYGQELQRRAELMTMIERRERGEDGTKPMPFANLQGAKNAGT